METELTALTEENNAKFIDLNEAIDDLKDERNKLNEIMCEQIANSSDIPSSSESSLNQNQQNIAYLLHEVETNAVAFADTLEENNQLAKTVEELTNKNKILSNRLREHGLDDAIVTNVSIHDVATVIRKAQVYQGMCTIGCNFLYKY